MVTWLLCFKHYFLAKLLFSTILMPGGLAMLFETVYWIVSAIDLYLLFSFNRHALRFVLIQVKESGTERKGMAGLACFKQALSFDSDNTKLWIEYGSLAYWMHSMLSRYVAARGFCMVVKRD